MSTFNYAGIKVTADRLIAKFGQDVTVSRQDRSGYQPATGTFSQVNSVYTATLAILPKPKAEREEDATQFTEQQGIVKSDTAPKIGDQIAANGENYRITAVRNFQPAETHIYYDIRLTS